MVATSHSRSKKVRSRVNHPIIDVDGHVNLLDGQTLDYVKQVGGARVAERYVKEMDEALYLSARAGSPYARMSQEERRDSWAMQPTWWVPPARNTLDRATSALPRLLHERMDELGIDLTILYQGFTQSHRQDDELRQVGCRAFNMWQIDRYREFSDRIIPSASIPMHTPEEAVAELEFAVKELGYKVVNIAGYVKRPIPKFQRERPAFGDSTFRLDFFGLDSAYDYDPVWAKCVELKVAPTTHSVSLGLASRRSISNYMYNHIGHFAFAAEGLCKALFMGGVTRRFPTLKFGFMESGVGWACNLYADIVGHWEKRNGEAIQNTNPANLDIDLMMELIDRYRDEKLNGTPEDLRSALTGEHQVTPEVLDDFAACRIEKAEDIRDLFVPSFYFGCEADDPMNVWAFNSKVNPFGARLQPLFSSDIGHWDVPDMNEVVAEAYEPVEKGLITEEDFRDFMFTNPVSLHAGMNPDFFKGTAVEADVARAL